MAALIARYLGEEAIWMDQPHPELWGDLTLQVAKRNPELSKVPAWPPGAPPGQEVLINHYDPQEAGASMGAGLELRGQPGVIRSWRVSRDWLDHNVRSHTGARNLCIVTGFGDSMLPMYNPGDPLLVDIGVNTVDFDAVYFFRIENQGYVKRLQRIPTDQGLILRAISENKAAYEPFDIGPSMHFEVLGRVLKVWRSQEF